MFSELYVVCGACSSRHRIITVEDKWSDSRVSMKHVRKYTGRRCEQCGVSDWYIGVNEIRNSKDDILFLPVQVDSADIVVDLAPADAAAEAGVRTMNLPYKPR